LFIFGSLSHILFTIGVWSLTGKWGIFTVMSIFTTLSIAFLLRLLPLDVGLGIIYAVITAGVLYLRFLFGKSTEIFVLGWILLCFTNIFMFFAELGWITDAFAILSKTVLFLGIVNEDFTTLPKRLESLMVSKKSHPIDTKVSNNVGRLVLVTPNPKSTRTAETMWIERQIEKALESNIDTWLFLIENLLPLDTLRRFLWMNPEKIHIIVFSSSAEEMKREFMVLNVDLHTIGATFHEILKSSIFNNRRCNVIIDSISTMIQLFGETQTYQLFIRKMGILRESESCVYGLIYPEIHNAATLSMFQKLSDSILKIDYT